MALYENGGHLLLGTGMAASPKRWHWVKARISRKMLVDSCSAHPGRAVSCIEAGEKSRAEIPKPNFHCAGCKRYAFHQ